ncbi:unnamed protein product, partial [Ectocarpus sp. 6 AP-2014]
GHVFVLDKTTLPSLPTLPLTMMNQRVRRPPYAMGTILRRLVLVCVATACTGRDSSDPRVPETEAEAMPSRRMNHPARFHSRNAKILARQSVLRDQANITAETVPEEADSIKPVAIPFKQKPDEFGERGHGLSLVALGEPKSGTTWLGRMVPSLAIELCGSENNPWCQLGGVEVFPHPPAPSYEFELLNISTPTGRPRLFLHFQGRIKHIIPGMDLGIPLKCRNGGRLHKEGFMDLQPCDSGESPTRERLESCLWNTTKRCVNYMTSTDPAVRRSIVLFRDPRDVVISEYKMRTQVFHRDPWIASLSLEEFVQFKFEVLVSWLHQRYMWHTGDLMGPSSHVEFYDELQQRSPVGFIGIARLMGLECSEDQAYKVWKAHKQASPNGGFATRVGEETIQFMNATMARLLPPSVVIQWGLTPTEV